MAWCLATYDNASNLGIYVCRPVRGGTSKSVHADGRADDVAFPVAAEPDPVVEALRLAGVGVPQARQWAMKKNATLERVQAIVADLQQQHAEKPMSKDEYFGAMYARIRDGWEANTLPTVKRKHYIAPPCLNGTY